MSSTKLQSAPARPVKKKPAHPNGKAPHKPAGHTTPKAVKPGAKPAKKSTSWFQSLLNTISSLFNKPTQSSSAQKTGVIKFFNRAKGFGFITDEQGKEVYVHISGLKSRVREHDKVTFTLEQGKKGLSAVNVTVVR